MKAFKRLALPISETIVLTHSEVATFDDGGKLQIHFQRNDLQQKNFMSS